MNKESDKTESIQDGYAKLPSGEIINKLDRCFCLKKHPDLPNIFLSTEGIVYRSINGCLRRVTTDKELKQMRKDAKKALKKK